jgi:hypothetical protein
MRVLLLIAAAAFSGCATNAALVPVRGELEGRGLSIASAQTTRTTTGRTQTVGLPLSRAGKIGLWTGVAVFLAYLMATDGEEDGAAPVDP